MKNKKGDFPSLAIILSVIFVLAIVSVIFVRVLPEISDAMATDPTFAADDQAVAALQTTSNNAAPFFDFMVLGVFVAFLLGLIISSIFIESHPAIIIGAILFFAVLIVVAAIFVNVWDEMQSNSEFAATASQLKYTNHLMGVQLPIIILVVGFIVVIILYGKSRGGIPT